MSKLKAILYTLLLVVILAVAYVSFWILVILFVGYVIYLIVDNSARIQPR
jgi:hypothetical protein